MFRLSYKNQYRFKTNKTYIVNYIYVYSKDIEDLKMSSIKLFDQFLAMPLRT